MCGSRKGIYVRIVDAFWKCRICGTEDASNRALQRKDSQWYISTHTTQVHLKKENASATFRTTIRKSDFNQ